MNYPQLTCTRDCRVQASYVIEFHKAKLIMTAEDDGCPSLIFNDQDGNAYSYLFNEHPGWSIFSAMATRDSINVTLVKD